MVVIVPGGSGSDRCTMGIKVVVHGGTGGSSGDGVRGDDGDKLIDNFIILSMNHLGTTNTTIFMRLFYLMYKGLISYVRYIILYLNTTKH